MPPRTKRPATRALGFGGADEETRTLDPRITSAVLYQLSYIGLARFAQLQSLSDSHAFVGRSSVEVMQMFCSCHAHATHFVEVPLSGAYTG